MSEQTKDIKDLDLLQDVSDDDRILMTKASEGHTAKTLKFADLKNKVLGSMEKPITSITKQMVEDVLRGNITSHSHAFAGITGKPTTLSGYGITDAPTKTGTGASGDWNINVSGQSVYLRYAGTTMLGTPGTGRIRWDYNVAASNSGLFPVTSNANGILTVNTHHQNYNGQLGFSSNGNLYYRYFNNVALNATHGWRTILDTGNYTTTLDSRYVTLSTTQTITGAKTFTGLLTSPRILLNRSAGSSSGISFYSSGYNAWQIYMSDPGLSNAGVRGNLTPPAGTYVTSWALRSAIEGRAGFGWTWERVDSSGTAPSIVAELSSATGNFRTIGSILTPSTVTASSFIGALSGNASSATKLQNTRTIFGRPFDGTGNVTGQALVYGNAASAGSGYANGGIQVREAGLVGSAQSSDQYAPRIGFHWGGRFGFSIIANAAGFKFLNQAETGYVPIYTGGMHSAGTIIPTSNGQYNLGGTSYRWAGIYTQLLNAAGAATLSSTLTVGSNITAGGNYTSSLNRSVTDTWNAVLSGSVFQNPLQTVSANTAQPMLSWSNQIASQGYITRFVIGSRRPASSFGEMNFWIGNNDTGTSGVRLGLSANGSGIWTGTGVFTFTGGISSTIVKVNNRLYVDNTGRISPISTSTRRAGMYGAYDAAKIGHIWSMGTAYMIPDDGSSFGNLYGLAYKHTNNTTGGTMAGGHQMVWCTNGGPRAALGENGIWSWSNIMAVGNITAGANIVATGEITAYSSSDIRLKENIRKLEALSFLRKVNTYSFDWKEDALSLKVSKHKHDHGFIAQEINQIAPHFVTHNLWGKGYLGIDKTKFIPYLVAGINELDDEFTLLKRRVDTLEKENKELRTLIKAIYHGK